MFAVWLFFLFLYSCFLLFSVNNNRLLTVPRSYFFCGSFMLCMSFVCHAFASVHCCLVATYWKSAGLLALFVMSNCDLSLSHVVSWVRCGT